LELTYSAFPYLVKDHFLVLAITKSNCQQVDNNFIAKSVKMSSASNNIKSITAAIRHEYDINLSKETL
jgi:hypothetical protein